MECVEWNYVQVEHPMVAMSAMQSHDTGLVAAVVLRAMWSRAERRRVLQEVAQQLQRQAACEVWVSCDLDVYQSIVLGREVDTSSLLSRPSTIHLCVQ